MNQKKNIICVGVGNPYRRDDGAGLFIIRELKKTDYPSVFFAGPQREGVDIVELWKDFDAAYIFDAVSSGRPAGTILRFTIPPDDIPKSIFNFSTHAYNIADVIQLARALKQVPPQIYIYGVEGKSFADGPGLSEEVKAAALHIVEEVKEKFRAVSASP